MRIADSIRAIHQKQPLHDSELRGIPIVYLLPLSSHIILGSKHQPLFDKHPTSPPNKRIFARCSFCLHLLRTEHALADRSGFLARSRLLFSARCCLFQCLSRTLSGGHQHGTHGLNIFSAWLPYGSMLWTTIPA